MRFRHKLGLNATPFVLRIALGTVFIWAGSSKLLNSDPFPGELGARLAEMGIIPKPATAGVVTPIVPESTPEPQVDEPAKPPVQEPAKAPETPADRPDVDPNLPDPAPGEQAKPELSMVVVLAAAKAPAPSAPVGAASEADKPVKLKRLYGLVLLMDKSSKPNAQGYILWPKFLSTPVWMERMAWAAALTEFIGGILILLGLLTRPAALGILCTMLTAMWLTQIGPSIGAAGSFLGFLPDPAMGDPTKWNSTSSGWLVLLWQFTLACVSLGLVMSGAGRLSMDSLIFRSGDEEPPKKFERPVEQPPKRPV